MKNKLKLISKTAITLLAINTLFSCAKEEVDTTVSEPVEAQSIMPSATPTIFGQNDSDILKSSSTSKLLTFAANKRISHIWTSLDKDPASIFYRVDNTLYEEEEENGEVVTTFIVRDTSDDKFVYGYEKDRDLHIALPAYERQGEKIAYWWNAGAQKWMSWSKFRYEIVCVFRCYIPADIEMNAGDRFGDLLGNFWSSDFCDNLTFKQSPSSGIVKAGRQNIELTYTDHINGFSDTCSFDIIGLVDDCETPNLGTDFSIPTWCYLSTYTYTDNSSVNADKYEWRVTGANIKVGNALVPQGDAYTTTGKSIVIATGNEKYNYNFTEELDQAHVSIQVRAKNDCSSSWSRTKSTRRNTGTNCN